MPAVKINLTTEEAAELISRAIGKMYGPSHDDVEVQFPTDMKSDETIITATYNEPLYFDEDASA